MLHKQTSVKAYVITSNGMDLLEHTRFKLTSRSFKHLSNRNQKYLVTKANLLLVSLDQGSDDTEAGETQVLERSSLED